MSGRRRRGPNPGAAVPAELDILTLGAGGDGIAAFEGHRVFVSGALPGERWRVRLRPAGGGEWRGEPADLLRPAPRADPVCRHFGTCGGCALQHLPDGQYERFKLDLVAAPLHRVGILPKVQHPLARSPLGSRRRLRLAWRRKGRQVELGYRVRGGREIVTVTECPIAEPALVALLSPLRALLAEIDLSGRPVEGEIQLEQADNGIDVLLGAIGTPGLTGRERLAGFAARHRLARLAIGQGDAIEPVVEHAAPLARIGGFAVPLPSGGFRQATAAGEAALQDAVRTWLGETRQLVDLYAGIGALSLPLLPGPALHLVEADPAAIQAASALARRQQLSGLSVEQRDLERRPLQPIELERFDAALLDPPRAGALPQIQALAASSIRRIAYVSCHPPSFARDAQVLRQAGFELIELRPVDQFLYAAAVELAALFIKA